MAYSTNGSEETLEDASLCSLCFEKFKSPRTLPCRHSFCHVCLSSTIESSCKEKEDPAGFRCPLCREFTPGVGEQKKWVNQFPINDVLVHILEISKTKLCGACKSENEEIPCINYCFECQEAMCEACTKFHGKLASSRSHTICPLHKAMGADLQPNNYKTCRKHPDRPVELVCNDHEQLCCALCAGTNHRKCKSVDTLDVTAGKIKDSDMIQILEENMKEYKENLLKAKRSMEENIDRLDDEADIFTKEIEKMEEDLIIHVKKAKDRALEKLAKATKTSKEKINKSTEIVDDQVQCIMKCQQTQADINTTSDVVKQVVEFFKTKQIYQKLQRSSIKKVITTKVKRECDVDEIKNQILFPTLEHIEFLQDINGKIDIRHATLKTEISFSVENEQIYFGEFLIDGSILLPQYWSDLCLLYDRNGNQIRKISTKPNALSVCLNGNEIYISCGTDKVIIVLSSETFAVSRSMTTEKPCYGLDVKYDQLYVACMDSIDLMDKNGEIIRSYGVQKSVECVIVNNQNMVYSNYEQHTVSAMSTSSQILWTYESPNLRFPFGIEHDSRDNVYITGKDSNNIHVLSFEGVLLRVFDNIKQPWFIAIPPDDDSTCCICSNKGDMTICRIV
uniref:Uncharacterized protein LOC111106999 n=1 Tax=Crassostrea virginica TaxID=6565 RepID=A0A8B8B3K7_CRAVI|nr:uncharacterized protein LOC111106999 [Crassostrea virginica]